MIAFGTVELLLVVVAEWRVLRSLFVVPRANKFKKLLDLAGGDTKLANELIALAGGNTEVALRVTKLVGGSKMKELLPYIDDLASFEKSLQMVGNDVAVINRLLIHTQSATKLQRILKSVPEAGKLSDEALEGVLKMSDDELRAFRTKNGNINGHPLNETIQTTSKIFKNSKGIEYPKVTVDGYGEIPFPIGKIQKVTPSPPALRLEFNKIRNSGKFKEWWIEQGRPWPEPSVGSRIDIHHIQPLGHGGTNSFENLVPLDYVTQHKIFNSWWLNY